MSNTIKVSGNDTEIEVYENKILSVFDEYLNNLEKPDEDIKEILIFTGAMKYIYQNVFKSNVNRLYNLKTNINTDNVELLEHIWNVYCNLCYKYKHNPTVKRFSIMTGITVETFNTWANNKVRANSKHSEFLKKCNEESENALYDSVAEKNSVGSLFLLKAVYGYRETSPLPPVEETAPLLESAETIREKHASAILPEKPDL